MFFTGARGGLLFSTLCLIYLYLSEAKTGKKQLIRVGSFSIFFLFIYLNLNRIISYISQYSNISRNLNTIINGQFFVSDSRMFLYNRCQDLINKKPWGYGPMGSRSALYGYPYPHSLWYELQLDYGKVFGILFFISIILVCILLLLFALKKKSAPLIGTICFIGVFQLFVSSTLYQEYCIPAIIALIISWNDKCNQLND